MEPGLVFYLVPWLPIFPRFPQATHYLLKPVCQVGEDEYFVQLHHTDFFVPLFFPQPYLWLYDGPPVRTVSLPYLFFLVTPAYTEDDFPFGADVLKGCHM